MSTENISEHSENDGHNHDHDDGNNSYVIAVISLVLLLTGLALEFIIKPSFFHYST